jgi:uncharacterized protein YdaU (DUF1376 family)
MTSDNYWIPWQAKDALISLSELEAEEIGVLIQIINLIYAYESAIENDAAHIGKLCSIRKGRCERIIGQLIEKKHIYINDDGKISKNRCEEELNQIRKKRRKKSKDGEKGAKIRWKNKENQEVDNGSAIFDEMAKTNTNKNQKEKTNTYGMAARQERLGGNPLYDIEKYLSADDVIDAKDYAPKWDIYALMKEYNQRIHKGTHQPPNHPKKAFLAWLKARTQGKPPP